MDYKEEKNRTKKNNLFRMTQKPISKIYNELMSYL